jgi:AcrR family transcriptional regulator
MSRDPSPSRGRGRRPRSESAREPVWARRSRHGRQRTPASAEEIVAAALAIADRDGMEAVSMRRVASDLGVGTMTLYTYVASKDDLLDLMDDAVMGELLLAKVPKDWRKALRAIAHSTRATWLRHPWLVSVISNRPRGGPNSMRHVEQSAQAVAGLELDTRDAFAVISAVDDYTIGYVFGELSMAEAQRRSGLTPAGWRKAMEPYVEEMLATGDFPHMSRFMDDAFDFLEDDRFDIGLEWLLDGIAAGLGR